MTTRTTEEISAHIAEHKKSVSLLARHFTRAGTLSRDGARMAARTVRVEFWAYNPESGRSERHSPLTVRAYGWSPRALRDLLVAACEAHRIQKIKERRARIAAARERGSCA